MLYQKKRGFVVSAVLALFVIGGVRAALAEQSPRNRDNLTEPVLRIAKATAPNPNAHPLDPAIELAKNGLQTIRSNINDYTCTMVKRERIDGKLMDYEYMFTKVRHRKVQDGQTVVPFSIYLYFLKPDQVKGREVLYVEGRNDDKMVAHEGGMAGKYLPTVWLRPTGMIAMRNQKYPLTDAGIENLVLKLIERAERDRANGNRNVQVTTHKNAKINGRTCTLLQVKNQEPSQDLDFHVAQIFIDDEFNVPIRYAAYDFPARAGDAPPVIEEYTYLNMKLNVGLTDRDFDHNNSDYSFN